MANAPSGCGSSRSRAAARTSPWWSDHRVCAWAGVGAHRLRSADEPFTNRGGEGAVDGTGERDRRWCSGTGGAEV